MISLSAPSIRDTRRMCNACHLALAHSCVCCAFVQATENKVYDFDCRRQRRTTNDQRRAMNGERWTTSGERGRLTMSAPASIIADLALLLLFCTLLLLLPGGTWGLHYSGMHAEMANFSAITKIWLLDMDSNSKDVIRHPNTYHTIEGIAELMQDTNPLNLACIYYSKCVWYLLFT